jgi:hypothetical protein
MKLSPSEDESQLPATQIAIHDLQVVESNLGFSFGMAGMEVREAVIVEEQKRFTGARSDAFLGMSTDPRDRISPLFSAPVAGHG